ELVDEDRDRHPAVPVHRPATGHAQARHQVPRASGRSSQAVTGLIVIPTLRARSNHGEGARIPGDAELMATFGVSRTVLRESVKTLVAKGLLTTKAGVGTVVRGRGAWNMFDADVLAWHLD